MMNRARRGVIEVGAALSVALTLGACNTVGGAAQKSRGVVNVAASVHDIARPNASAAERAAVASAVAAINAAADHQDEIDATED